MRLNVMDILCIMFENGKMISVETILGMGEREDKGQ
jgi:hypothetical protein